MNVDDDKAEIEIRKGRRDPKLWVYLNSCAKPTRDLWPLMTTEVAQHWKRPNANYYGDAQGGRRIYISTNVTRCSKDFIGMFSFKRKFRKSNLANF